MIILKKGYTPFLNETYADYDDFKLLCPFSSDYITARNNDSFYLYFMNSTRVNGFQGFVGFGIRELSTAEIKSYCSGTSVQALNSPPLITNSTCFTADFYLRAFASGCYYYDTASGQWESNGTSVIYDSDAYATHCLSSHLTAYAGGLVVLPAAINFEYVWAHASFLQNPIIYSTVIVMVCLYVLLAIWSRYMDKRDSKKLNILPLSDNLPTDEYFYEIITFTGSRPEAGTESNVIIYEGFVFILGVFRIKFEFFCYMFVEKMQFRID